METLSANEIHDRVAAQGWAVFHDDRVAAEDMSAMTTIANMFGIPSARDGGPLWPIVQRERSGTFSQTNAEAEFHTDAQYHREPEPYFLLFCVVAAACGGGANSLLHGRDVITRLDGSFTAREQDALRSPVWTWRTPQVFIDAGEPEMFSNAAVIDTDSIRWRFDNLVPADDYQLSLSRRFRIYLAEHPDQTTLSLDAGDVLLCDNRRALHARSSFSDGGRKLYRTRLR